MPSAPTRRLFLLDTNSYLRLANSFHPLIEREFGKPPCVLRVVRQLEHEIMQAQLRKKFPWALLARFVDDRKHYLSVSKGQSEAILLGQDYLLELAEELGEGASPVDCYCLAYAQELGMIVVTDDRPMRRVADTVGIPTMATIDLLRLMLEEGRATKQEIRNAVDVMEHFGDIPSPQTFWKQFEEWFGGDK
ncbi:MAG: hypothetical protein WCL50_04425 [Spirochaetota bacterium]